MGLLGDDGLDHLATPGFLGLEAGGYYGKIG